ncbi:putative histidine kinase HHK2p [Lophiostoma macrostomum CBS 122681]|uniref:histidine kinase n=1 Tax=Lophiostoma macrostomum CBS 122681 TaxID=1314788 RepID=A0A6A6SSM3_9PLEO|nr:putative histidine kinase HHK2p [Lophiostoma macrostomum CBS 122681]
MAPDIGPVQTEAQAAVNADATANPVTASELSPTTRPPLQRLSQSNVPTRHRAGAEPSRASAPPPTRHEDTTDSEVSDSAVEEEEDERQPALEQEGGELGDTESSDDTQQAKSSPDELEIERLRNLQLRLLRQQQRARVKSAVTANTANTWAARRVSPIKEETVSSMSPTLEGAFSSPLPTGLQTASTESTESARTIRGSVPPTPAAHAALRTPSYPFPTVPNTPRGWSSAFHQPFTNLSPTVSAMHQRDHATPRERAASETSTPAASAVPFAPSGTLHHSPAIEDPRFPTPSLYELVLQLGVEPGLTAWWSCVTAIVQEWYGAERATLAVPADASDIENVPWGQRTTFNLSHLGASPISGGQEEETFYAQQQWQAKQEEPERLAPTIIPEKRPKLPARHSFAGHERQRKDVTSESSTPGLPARPRGLFRTTSHMPQTSAREHPLRQVSPMSPVSFDGSPSQAGATSFRDEAFSDPEFSSIGHGAGSPPRTAVFPILRALDHEPDALIDNTGINRVLERGRLVTLTRDYSTSMSNSRKNSSTESEKDGRAGKSASKQPDLSEQDALRSSALRSRYGLSTKPGGTEYGDFRFLPRYEEYEQFPTSPWAQSPAPSPAVQNESAENPFFAAGNVDEDSFNPSSSTEDYTQSKLVEAIGVDRASTVTHIPLIHPTLSQVMQPADPNTPSRTPALSRRQSEQSIQDYTPRADHERKAPIAILSILSPIVPYPRNLTNSLKLLGPHLATTFSNAVQYTAAQTQATSISSRRFLGGNPNDFATLAQKDIDSLLHLDLENISSSTAGSVTSPSDYSGRSRHSPGGSIGGTPGWDPSAVGFSSKHSVSSTPGHLAGSEDIESYFDAKKKPSRGPSHSSAGTHDQGPRKTDRRASMKRAILVDEEDLTTPRNEKATTHTAAQDDAPGSSHRPRMPPSQGSHQRAHSLLHSYGADFSSSFQSLPAATTPGTRTPAGPTSHARSSSIAEALDMPPPSESLLRTIIDSLPVQIFTALPTTGALTWVNSKFLVYRGRDSREVLQEPWDAIHPEDRAAYLDQWNKSLRTGQQLQQKVRLQRFDGYYRWFYVRVAPLKNKRQQIVHWIGTNMDFHEQHLAELNSARQQETAASEAKYRALANSSPQIVFVVSNRRGLTFCNSQWLTYSGQTEAQAQVNGFLEYVHPDDVIKCKLPEMSDDGSVPTNVPTSLPSEHERMSSSSSEGSSETEKTVTSPGSSSPDRLQMPQAKLSKLAGQGILKVTKDAHGRPSYSTEVRLRSKEGDYRWHLVRILLEKVLAEDSTEETWYGTATDINDHKLLEQTLKETMDAKTRFLSNMSHEIRTPLNGISGMVNFLLDSPLNGEQLEHVNIIKASTDSLLNLINDILDLSKVEAGMIKLDMAWLHIPSLLEEVNDLNMGLAIQKGLELNYLVEEEVPLMVKGDKFRIRQVLLNVVGNAIKFTQKGEVFVRCRPCPNVRPGMLKDNESMVQFEVIDTGKGFNENEAKYLFKRFSQIDASSTRQHGGTGLGLAISMQFVELHGGKMDAKSVPNKGSTFFFTLKFGLPTEDDQPPNQAPTPGTPSLEPDVATAPPLPPQQIMLQQIAATNRRERMSSTSSEQSESIKSPAPSLTTSERSRESPSLSSGSSDPSVTGTSLTGKSSFRSERSSASSFMQEASQAKKEPIELALPIRRDTTEGRSDESLASDATLRAPPSVPRSLSPLGSALQPPMYSILVVCPLAHSREATIRHIKNTLPQGIPHQITGQANLVEAQKMIGGDDPVLFTHVVLVLHDTVEVIAIMEQTLSSMVHEKTTIVVVSDPAQKKELMKTAPVYDYDQLSLDRRLRFIYRPLKPSKFAVIFDPQKERESSTDRNQDTAQQVVVSQKLVFEELKNRLGDKGHRVLLVEDNKINQTVVLKFMAKISIETDTVLDGVQCTETVFSKPAGYYSIILCDLHMPNKDGYQACKEIRHWEKKHGYRRHPIVALSANVLGDVYAKCVEAGFNSYVTKPVEFKELSKVMTKFLDPPVGAKAPEVMKVRK